MAILSRRRVFAAAVPILAAPLGIRALARPPADPRHDAIRRAIADVELAYSEFDAADAESDAIWEAGQSDPGETFSEATKKALRDQDRDRVQPAREAVEEARSAMFDAMDAADCLAAVVGGVFYLSGRVETIGDHGDVVFAADRILNLDGIGGGR
jgi:hypothetical protein